MAVRTQAERRAASRTRLLDAAVASLAERGYAGTTFPEVLKRAELSNGALWRHFHSKADLMVAAAMHAAAGFATWPMPDDLDRRTPPQRLAAAVALFWEHAHQPTFRAFLELLAASRTDAELAGLLAASNQQAGGLFFDAFGRVAGPVIQADPQYERNVRLLGLVLYGVSLTSDLRTTSGRERLGEEVQEMMAALFGFPAR